MQTITVKSVVEKHSKDGTKTFYLVSDDAGGEYTTFDSSIAAITGNQLEIEPEVKGKYINIKSFKVIKEAEAIIPKVMKSSPNGGDGDSIKRASIERQVALKCACDTAPEDATIEQILVRAFFFYNWLRQASLPQIATKTDTVVPGSETVYGEAHDKSGQKHEPLPDFKTGKELVTYATKVARMYWGVIQEKLSIKTPDDIKVEDIPKAKKILWPEL